MTFNLNNLKQILSKPKNISIIIHRNPDGDAIGSGLALFKFLQKKGHAVSLISPNIIPDYLSWLPDTDKVIVYDSASEQTMQALKQSELIFTLDFNNLSRTGEEMESIFQSLSNKTFVMIDHHPEPSGYAQFMFSDPEKSSTAEMVYDFMVELEEKDLIDKEIAECLYTGIVTDTGSFQFPNTTAHTLRVAADLMDKGVSHTKINLKVFSSFTTNKLHLLGEALNKLVFLPEYKTSYIVLSQEDLKKHQYKKGDTEGFVNYGLALSDSIFSVLFLENEDHTVRISFRSKGKVPANEFAKKYFNGGGHLNAAGGRSEDNLQKTVDMFLSKLSEFKKQLLQADE
jgi:phosphoesterase RecJ-like protein